MSDHPIHVHRLTGSDVRALERGGERHYLMTVISGDKYTDLLIDQTGIEDLRRQIDKAISTQIVAGP